MDIKQLVEQVERLFADRLTYMQLLQEIAEHFYPERADFTIKRTHGNEYAGDLNSSYPIMIRRDLGDQIGQMLRPTSKEWFHITPKDEEYKKKLGNEDKRWIEWAELQMRRAMYARPALFARATKEADQDFATFGACPMTCEINRSVTNLLYRSWHIRDVVWQENEDGGLGIVARKWKPTARDLVTIFKNKTSPKVQDMLRKRPFERLKVFHIRVEADLYSDNAMGRPYWNIFYDCEHKHIMEAIPVWVDPFIIPRWQTVSGSQYPFSPATITALPEARMLQSMAFTLLEAGEKATNPPMVATQDVVRSDVSIYAGGITWVDQDYDERLGQALRPVQQDLRGLPFGLDMIDDSRSILAQAFYLNKLTLPERAPEMTAYEVGQRIQEYIRGALPIFEPMEYEYNGGICEATFKQLFQAGVLGAPEDMPDFVRRSGLEFEFESPLHDAIEERQGQVFLESKALIAEALEMDRGTAYIMDAREALRDSLSAIGVPAEWMNSRDDVDEMVDAEAEAEDQQMQLEQMVQGSEVAKNLGQAGQNLEMI